MAHKIIQIKHSGYFKEKKKTEVIIALKLVNNLTPPEELTLLEISKQAC